MRESTQYYNLTLEVPRYHFRHFLLVTKANHGTVQEGNTQGGMCTGGDCWEPSGMLDTTGTQHTGREEEPRKFSEA